MKHGAVTLHFCSDPVPAVQAAPQGDRGAGRHRAQDLHGEARHLQQEQARQG